MKQEQAEASEILASSGVGSDDLGIGYGGVDNNGSLDPSVREYVLDDEDDDW